MKNPGAQLKREIKRSAVVLPGTYDCITTLLIERQKFKAAYVSGAGLSVTYLGKPDVGHLGLADVNNVVERMTAISDLPLIVDADTGFGPAQQIPKTVRTLEQAGAAGLQLEDQEFPKRCGHLQGKTVVSPTEMVHKIKLAVRARKNKDFLIVARTDARAVEGFDAALYRATLYKKAGADVIFPEALQTREEFARFARKKELGTLMANMTEFALSPALTVTELSRLGYRLIIFPMTACRIAAHAIENALHELKAKGSSRSMVQRMQTRQNLYQLIRYKAE